jgi:hypothetical protein
MKNHRLSSISSAARILLFVYAMGLESVMAGTSHTGILPNYVKHNQSGVATPTPTGSPLASAATASSTLVVTPFITVELIPDSGKQIIQYSITDRNNRGGTKHSKKSTVNEKSSDLYTTTFVNDIAVIATTDGEVIIAGTAESDNKIHAWKSDSKIYFDSGLTNSDVRWIDLDCD